MSSLNSIWKNHANFFTLSDPQPNWLFDIIFVSDDADRDIDITNLIGISIGLPSYETVFVERHYLGTSKSFPIRRNFAGETSIEFYIRTDNNEDNSNIQLSNISKIRDQVMTPFTHYEMYNPYNKIRLQIRNKKGEINSIIMYYNVLVQSIEMTDLSYEDESMVKATITFHYDFWKEMSVEEQFCGSPEKIEPDAPEMPSNPSQSETENEQGQNNNDLPINPNPSQAETEHENSNPLDMPNMNQSASENESSNDKSVQEKIQQAMSNNTSNKSSTDIENSLFTQAMPDKTANVNQSFGQTEIPAIGDLMKSYNSMGKNESASKVEAAMADMNGSADIKSKLKSFISNNNKNEAASMKTADIKQNDMMSTLKTNNGNKSIGVTEMNSKGSSKIDGMNIASMINMKNKPSAVTENNKKSVSNLAAVMDIKNNSNKSASKIENMSKSKNDAMSVKELIKNSANVSAKQQLNSDTNKTDINNVKDQLKMALKNKSVNETNMAAKSPNTFSIKFDDNPSAAATEKLLKSDIANSKIEKKSKVSTSYNKISK